MYITQFQFILTKVRCPYSHCHANCHFAFFSQLNYPPLKTFNLTETLNTRFQKYDGVV